MKMSALTNDFDTVRIFSDELSDVQILKKISDEQDGEDPFHIVNIGDIYRKHQIWMKKLPRITPHYGNI